MDYILHYIQHVTVAIQFLALWRLNAADLDVQGHVFSGFPCLRQKAIVSFWLV